MADEAPPDQWTSAVAVVDELVQSYIAQKVPEAEFDSASFDRVMERFESLAVDIREQLSRHLSLLLGGGVQDSLDAERSKQIEQDRMGGDRVHRVPLFFEPDPEPPRRRSARPPQNGMRHWVFFIGGTLMLLGGVGVFLTRVAAASLTTAMVLTALWTASSLLLAVHGPRYLTTRAENRRRQDPFPPYIGFVPGPGPRPDTDDDRPSGALVGVAIARLVQMAPETTRTGPRFVVLATEAALSLARVLHHLYGRADHDPVPALHVDWLVRWHARRIIDAWTSGDLQAAQEPRRLRWPERLLLGTAGAAAAAGAGLGCRAVAPAAQDSAGGLALSALLLCVGGWTILQAAPIYCEVRRYRVEQEVDDRLHELKLAAYQDEVLRLSERPNDLQMAEWLDYDKDHIRIEAMRTWKLTNRDVITHVVLTEQAENSISACEPEGPRRFSRYLVRLFLLTGNGVRQLNVEIDFASGALNNEQRFAFRYDAIASVRITEPTVWRHGRRQIATPRGGGLTAIGRDPSCVNRSA